MKKYWFHCKNGISIGVTSYNLADAIRIISLERDVYRMEPDFEGIACDITLRDIDENHVVPNMGSIVNRGIWFPNLPDRKYALDSDVFLSIEPKSSAPLNKVCLDKALRDYLKCGLKHAKSLTEQLIEFEKLDIKVLDSPNLAQFLSNCAKANAKLTLI